MNIRNRCRSFRFQENDNIRKMSLNVLCFIINQLRYRYIKKKPITMSICHEVRRKQSDFRRILYLQRLLINVLRNFNNQLRNYDRKYQIKTPFNVILVFKWLLLRMTYMVLYKANTYLFLYGTPEIFKTKIICISIILSSKLF